LGLADVLSLSVAVLLSTVILGDDALTPLILLAPFGIVVAAKLAGLYDRDEHLIHKTTLDEIPALFTIASVAALLLWLAGDLLIEGNLERRQIFGTWVLMFVLIVLFRSLARRLAQSLTPPERCLIVGANGRVEELTGQLELHHGAVVVGSVDEHGASATRGLQEALHHEINSRGVERVILGPGGFESDSLMFAVRELKAYGVKVSLLPDISRLAGSSVEVDRLGSMSLLGMRQFEITRSSRLIKRAFDLSVSAGALLMLSPLLVGISVAIRVDSRGPALYRQRRIGRDGREFQMVKFRSMRQRAHAERSGLAHLDEGAEGLFKIREDPRVTRIGRIIRGSSVDELPQLLNVLRGEMSLVGPRPLVPEEDNQIEGLYRRRLDVPPGMTGHWQVLGSARVPLAEMVKLDYLYAANWSLWGDVRLILRTAPIVFGRRSM